MKVLVTGGTGFTGAALVRRLISLNHEVTVIDNKEGLIYEELKEKGANIYLGSITDNDFLKEKFKGIDVVFHVAAAFRELNVPREHYFKVNVEGTRNVLENSYINNVSKFIYCSTQGVHGHVDNPPGDENSPIDPEDYYQETKYEGEKVVQEYIKKGLKATIIRPTAIYGPGDPERFYMIFKRAIKGSFPMFGDGKTFYHPVYIENLVDAFILSMDPAKGTGQTYIIADDKYVCIEDLVKKVGAAMNREVKIKHYPLKPLRFAATLCEKVCQPLGVTPPIFPRRVDWFRQVRAFKIDKAVKELGYHPKISLDEGLKQTANWYKERKMLNYN